LIKALRHLKPDEILLLLSLNSSESSLSRSQSFEEFQWFPSGPQALKVDVDKFASLISKSFIC